jgi:hypothetical protein
VDLVLTLQRETTRGLLEIDDTKIGRVRELSA